jgi:dihydroflavonol-4-reductase
MKVLVTGASGFLGGYLTRELVRRQFEVTALIRDPKWKQDGVRAVVGNVMDPKSLEEAVEGQDAVFHLAALVALKRADRQSCFDLSVNGTENVVEACARFKIKRLVHVSSVVSVGASTTPGKPLNESADNILKGKGFSNFEAKLQAEEIVLEAVRAQKIDAVVVNPSMIFGAGDAKKAARKGNVLAAKGKLPFYPPGGINVVAVEDVVDGIIQAFEKGKSGERYILSGDNMTFKEVLTLYSTLAGVKPPKLAISATALKMAGRFADSLKTNSSLSYETALAATLYHWFDHSKATRELGFSPRPGRVAIENSVKWILRQK